MDSKCSSPESRHTNMPRLPFSGFRISCVRDPLPRRSASRWQIERKTTMADEPKEQPAQSQIQVQVDAQHATGVYSNLMMITHRKEEFILDFLFVQPQRNPQRQAVANLRSRVITTPEHMKRILKAMEENIDRYEQTFGVIQAATDMPKVVH